MPTKPKPSVMKIRLIFLFLVLSLSTQAEIDLKIYTQEVENGYVLFADNGEICPVSVVLTLKLDNMKSTKGGNPTFVIPANQKTYQLTLLTVQNPRKAYEFSFRYQYHYGDTGQETYDKDFAYHLPYAKESSYLLWQGYNGRYSHQNENALDFSMPVGTPVYAARDGWVVDLVEHNNRNCPDASCGQFNNYLLIYHSDGTFAEYTHIKQNGALPQVGDRVEIGELIAYSGNVGWSSGPHLHFVVFLQRISTRTTLKTQFRIGDGTQLGYLKEQQQYQRGYD